MICGSFGVSTLYAGLQRVQIGLVSRLSSLRPGTRFNVRGVDDNGYVANFVETELVRVFFSLFTIAFGIVFILTCSFDLKPPLAKQVAS